MNIKIKNLIKGKKTYPNWSTKLTYDLKSKDKDGNVLVYYKTKQNKIFSRLCPSEINLTPKLCYVLGFLKGEGSTSLGSSNYRRFTITNSDSTIIYQVLQELEKSKLFKKEKIIRKSIHLLHFQESKEKVINYWSRKLKLPKDKFKCFNDERKTSLFGVCHIYISDVLLRRVIDLIHEEFNK